MKAIIPVAGSGTRLRSHTYAQPKALIPLAGKTVLSNIIDQLYEEGKISEFIFIIGYLGEKIMDYVNENYPSLTTHFIRQTDLHGIGHAIKMTKNIVNGDEVVVTLGDTICEYNVEEMINQSCSVLAVKKVDDPRHFGVAEIDEKGFVCHVIEKPQIPKSNMALVGIYKIIETNLMFKCLEENFDSNIKNPDGYNLTDALESMIQKGCRFKALKVENWFDCGNKNSLLESNAILLKKFSSILSETVQLENTVLVQPVSIGKNCVIKNSVIGPNVSVGDNSKINYSILKNSLIGCNSDLYDIVLENSLIGVDASIKGESRKLSIGDNVSIDLG